MSLTDPRHSAQRHETVPADNRSPWRSRRAGAALAQGTLAGLGALAVLTAGVWMTEDNAVPPWGSWAIVAVVITLTWLSAQQLREWNHHRAHPVTTGHVASMLLAGGLILMFGVGPILSASGAPEAVVGEVGLLAIVALLAAGILALTRRHGRPLPSGTEEGATAPPPGAGTDYAEWSLRQVTQAPGALRPFPDEEKVLEQAISQEYGFFLSRSGAVLLSLPTVVRQADMVLQRPYQEAMARGRDVMAAARPIPPGAGSSRIEQPCAGGGSPVQGSTAAPSWSPSGSSLTGRIAPRSLFGPHRRSFC